MHSATEAPLVSPLHTGVPLNVASRLTEYAGLRGDSIAVVCSRRASQKFKAIRGKSGAWYSVATFAEVDSAAAQIAHGLIDWGVPAGTRLALLVRPGIEFVSLVFGLLRAGMVIVLVDPGMGRQNLIRCLADSEPEGFVAIGVAQAARCWWRKEFPRARWNVTVGRKWLWGGLTLDQLMRRGERALQSSPGDPSRNHLASLPKTSADDAAAIIFTSGSTGVPKGVLYTHRIFDTQVCEIQSKYGIEPGGVDLGCFPLFALFNSAMGVTTVLPEMDFSRPASADPQKLLAAANDWAVTQAFASPAVWRVLSEYCAKTGEHIPSLKQVFSCGAPVPADVLRSTLSLVGDGAKMHTPYGATECLPVATIEAQEVLNETTLRTNEGAGVCVGRKFDSVNWRAIRITDEPISAIEDVEELPCGEIGELIVRGPQASPRYVTRTEHNAVAKIGSGKERDRSLISADVSLGGGDAPARSQAGWHRMGDVGYFDEAERFWYCGRKSHRVETKNGPLFTECVEAVFNTHPAVRRSALVGIGKKANQTPVLIVERQGTQATDALRVELIELAKRHPTTRMIERILFYSQLPVDVRHNAKIHRESLAEWAASQLPELS